MSTLGIDISVMNGTINFSQVYSSGKRFCIVKSSQGQLNDSSTFEPKPDSKFLNNVDDAYAAGLDCGSYHYMNSITMAQVNQEADYCISRISQKRSKLTLPIFIDIEKDLVYNNTEYKERNTELVLQFARKISKAGFIPGIATYRGFYYYYINYSALNEIRIWVSWVDESLTESKVLSEFPNAVIWQMYVGTCPGVSGDVDIDTGFFDRPITPVQLELNNPGGACYIDYGRKYLVIPPQTTESILRDYIKNSSISINKSDSSSNYCGTGSTVNILSNGSIVNSYETVVLGDLNGSGKPTPDDYVTARRILLGTYTPTPLQRYATDYDEDGNITDTDCELIRSAILGAESQQL